MDGLIFVNNIVDSILKPKDIVCNVGLSLCGKVENLEYFNLRLSEYITQNMEIFPLSLCNRLQQKKDSGTGARL